MSSQVLNQISFALETTWGTPVAPTKSIPVHFSGGLNTKTDLKYIEGVKAVIAKEQGSVIGAQKHDGDYQMDLFTDYPPYFMYLALGAINSTVKGGESVVYQHTITESATKPSMTLEQVYGEEVSRFAGTMVSDLKFNVKAGEIATLETKLMAKSRATGQTKITPAYRNDTVFPFNQFAVKIGGSTVTEVVSIELEYKNNLQFLPALNSSNDVAFNYVKASEVTGKITLYLDSTTLTQLTNYLANTKQAVEIVGTGAAIGTSSNLGIDILVPKCSFKTFTEKLSDGYNTLEIEFTGEYDTATSQLMKIIATNLLTQYN